MIYDFNFCITNVLRKIINNGAISNYERTYKNDVLKELKKQCWIEKRIIPENFNNIAEKYKNIINEEFRINILNIVKSSTKSFMYELSIQNSCDKKLYKMMQKKILNCK